MHSLSELRHLELFEALSEAQLEAIRAHLLEIEFESGDFILHQHDEADALYVLLSGTVVFLIRAEGVDDLQIGTTSEHGALLGWSIVREPHRYTASIRCTETCRVLRLPREILEQVLAEDPRAEFRVLQVVAGAVADRLQETLRLLGGIPKAGPRPEA